MFLEFVLPDIKQLLVVFLARLPSFSVHHLLARLSDLFDCVEVEEVFFVDKIEERVSMLRPPFSNSLEGLR
jgi:hypothetical protein